MCRIIAGEAQNAIVYLPDHSGGMLTGKELLVAAAAATSTLATLATLGDGDPCCPKCCGLSQLQLQPI